MAWLHIDRSNRLESLWRDFVPTGVHPWLGSGHRGIHVDQGYPGSRRYDRVVPARFKLALGLAYEFDTHVCGFHVVHEPVVPIYVAPSDG
jgi:hypothetical protein